VWWLFLLSGSWGQNTGVAFCLCIIWGGDGDNDSYV
jgi:hypothetical protein